MDPSVPNADGSVFNIDADWKELYGDMVEEDPHQISESLGKPVYFG